jgi:hypothetical protein
MVWFLELNYYKWDLMPTSSTAPRMEASQDVSPTTRRAIRNVTIAGPSFEIQGYDFGSCFTAIYYHPHTVHNL